MVKDVGFLIAFASGMSGVMGAMRAGVTNAGFK